MRIFFGPVVLAVLVLVSLWSLLGSDRDLDPAEPPRQPQQAPLVSQPVLEAGPVEPMGTPIPATASVPALSAEVATQHKIYKEVAQNFMATFARPTGKTEQQWWLQVKPWLTRQAILAYEGTDPANIPFTVVTGKATVIPSSQSKTVLLRLPTDAGWYQVLLALDEHNILVESARPETPEP